MTPDIGGELSRRSVLKAFGGLGAGATVGGVLAGTGPAGAQSGTNGLAQVESDLRDFMDDHNVPGLSLAITDADEVVYAKGFGHVERYFGTTVEPYHRFRIASISKPITATAVLRLIGDGKLSLDDQVFGEGGVLPADLGRPIPPNLFSGTSRPIQVEDLLDHTSGYQFDDDPVYVDPDEVDGANSLTKEELIQWVTGSYLLDADPATADYDYQNFNYLVLGKIVEHLSGASYESYTRRNVLAPCGAPGLRITNDERSGQWPREVTYHPHVDDDGEPYGEHMVRDRSDAHGGWIASPVELLRFADTVTDRAATVVPTEPDDRGLFHDVFEAPGTGDYEFGWTHHQRNTSTAGNDNAVNRVGHDGNLPGSSSMLRVQPDRDYSYAVLLNTRPEQNGYRSDLEDRVDAILDAVRFDDVTPAISGPLPADVSPGDGPAVALTGPDEVAAGEAFTLRATSLTLLPGWRVVWCVRNGGQVGVGTGITKTLTFEEPGTYEVLASLVTPSAMTVESTTVTVEGLGVRISGDDAVAAGSRAAYSHVVSNAVGDVDYEWTVERPDGTTRTKSGPGITIEPATAGTATLTLAVADDVATATDEREITVEAPEPTPTDEPPTEEPPTDEPPTDEPPTDEPPTDEPPTDVTPTDTLDVSVAIEGPRRVTEGSSAVYTASVTDAEDSFTYRWEVRGPDGRIPPSPGASGQTLEWTFEHAGRYVITLTVSDGLQTVSRQTRVRVEPADPTPTATPTDTATPTPTDAPTATPTPSDPPLCDPSQYPGAPRLSTGAVPRDVDGDGVHEDFNENCRLDSDDVVTFFDRKDADAVAGNPSYYDLNGNSRVDFDDVVQLFGML